MTAGKPLRGIDLTRLEERDIFVGGGTRAWLNVRLFSVAPEGGAGPDLIAALLRHPSYRDQFFAAGGTRSRVHGPFWLSSLNPSLFSRVDHGQVASNIGTWLSELEANQEDRSRVLDVVERLLDGVGEVYILNNPGEEAEHDAAFQVAAYGFNEFVLIDDNGRRLTLVVTCDD